VHRAIDLHPVEQHREHITHDPNEPLWGSQGAGLRQNQRINLMRLPMHQAPRCRARSKRSGKPFRSPAVAGHSVCRMHGARGGAPIGNRNARKHGNYAAEAIALRRKIAELARAARCLADAI
jgi:glucans biosynthesis protein